MKKIIYIAVCYFIGIGMTLAQTVTTFNKLYPAGFTCSIFDLPNNSAYYSLFYISQNRQPQQTMAVSKIDLVGNQISIDTLHLRSNSLVEGISAAYTCIQSFDNKVIMVLTINKNCTDCIEGCIIKFNAAMTDTLWTKTYKFQGQNAQLEGITEDPVSHNLYIQGMAHINSTYVYFFACFDANGNLLWEKKYDRIPNVVEEIRHLAIIGNYLALAGLEGYSNGNNAFTAFYDLNGNYLFRQGFSRPYDESVTGLCTLNNQEVLVVIGEGTEPMNSNFVANSRILLQRINVTTNTVVQSKYIGINDKNVFGRKPYFLDNNKIIFAGSRWDTNRNVVSGIYAINTNLDSLWYREYPNEIEPQNYIFWSQDAQIYNTMVSNGSIFTAGEFFTDNTPTAFPPGSPNQYAWVMKLDTAGCLTPGCWTSVTDKTPDIWIADDPLGLYPNPAHTQITLRLPDAPNAYQIDIFDAHGKRMFDEPRMAADCTISTVGFPSGTYFCRATYAGKRLGMAKFVVAQ
ncbi:MAG: Secretion system C-terminal sorting domain [Bacteroidota bacterium]